MDPSPSALDQLRTFSKKSIESVVAKFVTA
jgi:hypothetical protein